MKGERTGGAAKLLSALGLCAKAGKLIAGVPMICEALAGKRPPILVLYAEDNAKNSAKRLSDKCAFYGVRLVASGADGATLGHAVGKSGRLAAVAVTDAGLARLVESTLPTVPDGITNEQNGT